MRAYRLSPWTARTDSPEDPKAQLHLALHKNTPGDFPVTHSLSERIDGAFSTFAMVGLLSPLVLAVISVITA